MASLKVSFDDIWANVDFPDQIAIGKQNTLSMTTNSPGDIGVAISVYSPDIELVGSDVQGPGIDRHKLSLQIGFGETSTSFTPPSDAWKKVTTKNRIAFQVEVTAVTAAGVGTTARTTVYAVADQSFAPTFNLNISPSTGVIQGITSVNISITGESTKYGASVSSRTISADGRSSGGTSLSIIPISSGAVAISATVKDSRGLSTTKTATVNVAAYSPPALRSFAVARVDSSGSPDEEGTFVKLSVVWDSGSGDTGSNSCSVKYRQVGAEAYADCFDVVSGQEYLILDVVFSTDYEYEFIVTVTDNHTTIEKPVILERGFFTLDFREGGKGMAIGQACTEDGLTVNMPTSFKQALSFAAAAKQSLVDLFYPVGAIYLSFSSTNPQTLFGGTWVQLTGRFLRMANDTGTGGNDTLTAANLPSHSHGLNGHTHSFSGSASHSHNRFNVHKKGGGAAYLGMFGDDKNQISNGTTDNLYRYASYYDTAQDSGTNSIISNSVEVKISGNTGGNSGSTANAGSGGLGNNMPAYQNVYAWRRTA